MTDCRFEMLQGGGNYMNAGIFEIQIISRRFRFLWG